MTNPPSPVRTNQAVEFLRVVQQHHIQLSSMADFKANVLLGASFLIFGASSREIRDGQAGVPVIALMLTAFVTATLVVLAMLPATSRARNPTPNLLFFGVFTQMPEQQFQAEMRSLLHDEDKLFDAMIRDIYQLGWVLQTKKYKHLGQAYQVFFCGLMISGLALAGETAWKMIHP